MVIHLVVELFPYYARTKGLSWYQLWQKGSGFFSTFVNPIGLDAISWKFLFVYLCVIVFELFFVWFFFPETSNRSLEELAFRECFTLFLSLITLTDNFGKFLRVRMRKTK